MGCGGGILTETLASADAQVTGLDLSEALIQVAKAHATGEKLDIDYQVKSIEDFAKTHAHTFDVITCMELLEHVPDPQAIIQACAECLKPDGHVFLSTLNRTPKSFLFAIVGAEYILNLLPRGTHEYRKLIKPSELHRWGRKAGLKLMDCQGMHYQPITGKAKLTKDVSLNYLVHFQPKYTNT